MEINEKMAELRRIMERENLSAYIISGTDPHNSEYLPAPWQQRKWISGFTGSYGTIVITKNDAGLWTDTRYFIQAENELNGTEIKLHKLRVPDAIDYPEWLAIHLNEGDKIGFDGFCMPVAEISRLETYCKPKDIELVEKIDLLGEIWLDRPALPENPIFNHLTEFAGVSACDKIKDIQDYLSAQRGEYIIFSYLDEIAWLYNLRGTDILFNPVFISYAIVSKEKAFLFTKRNKISKELEATLNKTGIEVRDYHHLFLFLEEINKDAVFIADTTTLNYAVYRKLKSRFQIKETVSPIILKKAIKNNIEIEGTKKACIEDGVAMTRFFYWLEKNVGEKSLTETEVADRLTQFRSESKDYFSDSFHTISAYGKNAALPHYSAVSGKDAVLEPKGLYLVDSGGQYPYGTTDITRTVKLGEISEIEREDYTLVLKGMINLSTCIFPKGTTGSNIDILARNPLWQNLRNFGHGTGHGIGHFLCVHEKPQDIGQTLKDQPLLPGMITSNEPGMYRENFHGVRHENMILCKKITENEFGEWFGFETLTLCYFDTSALNTEIMTKEEIEWLNKYHKMVFEKLSPYLNEEEKEWLKNKTRAI